MTAVPPSMRHDTDPELLPGVGHGVPGPSSGPTPGNPGPATAADELRAQVRQLAGHEVELEAALAAAAALIDACAPAIDNTVAPQLAAWASARRTLDAAHRTGSRQVLRQVGWLSPYGIVPGGLDVDPAPHWRPIWAFLDKAPSDG